MRMTNECFKSIGLRFNVFIIPYPLMKTSRETIGMALGFFGMCLFAGTLPATRLAVQGLDPWLLTAARAAFAGLAGLVVLLVARRRLPPRSAWLEIICAAACTVVGFPLFAALALQTVPAAHGGVVLGVLPIATAVAAMIFAHERPSAGFWLASAAGAIIVLVFAVRKNGGETLSADDLFLLGMVVSGALGYTLSGRLSALMPGWEVISWQVVVCLPMAALATVAMWPHDLARVTFDSWAGLAYVALISQFSAFFVFNAALAMGGIARVGQVMLLQPFMVVALAAAVNHEPINIETVLFAVAVVTTVLIGQRTRVIRS
jgi:drug/metabolite transporter (DMT)-like permease